MALIAVVTPADKSSPTVEALSEELAGFGYDVQDEPIFKVYSATDYANGIQDAAQACKR
jgi:hypothetical protein